MSPQPTTAKRSGSPGRPRRCTVCAAANRPASAARGRSSPAFCPAVRSLRGIAASRGAPRPPHRAPAAGRRGPISRGSTASPTRSAAVQAPVADGPAGRRAQRRRTGRPRPAWPPWRAQLTCAPTSRRPRALDDPPSRRVRGGTARRAEQHHGAPGARRRHGRSRSPPDHRWLRSLPSPPMPSGSSARSQEFGRPARSASSSWRRVGPPRWPGLGPSSACQPLRERADRPRPQHAATGRRGAGPRADAVAGDDREVDERCVLRAANAAGHRRATHAAGTVSDRRVPDARDGDAVARREALDASADGHHASRTRVARRERQRGPRVRQSQPLRALRARRSSRSTRISTVTSPAGQLCLEQAPARAPPAPGRVTTTPRPPMTRRRLRAARVPRGPVEHSARAELESAP